MDRSMTDSKEYRELVAAVAQVRGRWRAKLATRGARPRGYLPARDHRLDPCDRRARLRPGCDSHRENRPGHSLPGAPGRTGHRTFLEEGER